MFKKLSASIFALALVAGAFVPAQAQDTIAIYYDDLANPGPLTRFGNTTPGSTFDIVVITKTTQSSSAGEAPKPARRSTTRCSRGVGRAGFWPPTASCRASRSRR